MALLSTTSPLLIGTTSLTNISSARHRPPSLAAQRVEGWTEVWGGRDNKTQRSDNNGDDGTTTSNNSSATMNNEDNNLSSRYVTVLKEEYDYIGYGASMNKTDDNDADTSRCDDVLLLKQHRIAWYEQLVLRMNFIPHVVENSSYVACESTGALPYLLDLSSSVSNGNGKPVLIGRTQPGGMGSSFFQHDNDNDDIHQLSSQPQPRFIPSGSHIVDYLRYKHNNNSMLLKKHNLLFPEHLNKKEEQTTPQDDGINSSSHTQSSSSSSSSTLVVSSDAMAYESLIQDKLNYILLALRYGHDPVWEGVYKQQCIRATLHPNGSDERRRRKPFFSSVWAWYQAYSERSLILHNLLPVTRHHANMPISNHGGLSLELFRFNDYRRIRHHHNASSSKSSDSDNNDNESIITDNEKKSSHQHQHHPFSSFIPSYGGIGGGDTNRINLHRALEYADMYYTTLELKLTSNSGYDTLLGTKIPTYIDALLFAHLAEALCDVHLILVLSKHDRLVKYFQWVYHCFFGDGYEELFRSSSSSSSSQQQHGNHMEEDLSTDWIKKNNLVNAVNAYNQIPEVTAAANKSSSSCVSSVKNDDDGGHCCDNNMVHAIQLMQQLAVHSSELDEAIKDAAALRAMGGNNKERVVLESYHRPFGSCLYQWIMGGDVHFWGSSSGKKAKTCTRSDDDDNDADDKQKKGTSTSTSEEEEKQRKMMEHVNKMKRNRRANDEMWISGVVITIALALFVSAAGKSIKK